MTTNAVAELVTKAPKFQPAEAARRFRLLTADEASAVESAPYLVKGTIPARGIGIISGSPGSGKTFVITSALVAISEGEPWFGMRTRQGPALYIGLEGAGGLANRVKALREAGHSCDAMRFMSTALDIRDAAQREELINTIKASGIKFAAVAIDTFARATPGADENSGLDMGQSIAALADMEQALQAPIIAVHHVGKDTTRGPRGHSSLLAAVDFAIEVRRDGDTREWQLVKAKDAPDGTIQPFTLRIVDLDRDDDGDPITSCVVHEMLDAPAQQRRVKAPTGGNQRIAWLAINDLLSASQEFGTGPAPATRKCISLESAIEAAGARFAVEPKRRRERATTAITGLAGRGCVCLKDEVLWLP